MHGLRCASSASWGMSTRNTYRARPNELRPRGVDARAPSALDRVRSRPFDDTGASVAALLASCQDAASQVRERWAGRPKAACIARISRARVRFTSAPIATWPNCDPKDACSGCSKSASSSAFSNAAIRTTGSRACVAPNAVGVRLTDDKGKPKVIRFAEEGNNDIVGAVLSHAINKYDG